MLETVRNRFLRKFSRTPFQGLGVEGFGYFRVLENRQRESRRIRLRVLSTRCRCWRGPQKHDRRSEPWPPARTRRATPLSAACRHPARYSLPTTGVCHAFPGRSIGLHPDPYRAVERRAGRCGHVKISSSFVGGKRCPRISSRSVQRNPLRSNMAGRVRSPGAGFPATMS